MRTETHSAIVQLYEGCVAFIDGIPDTCDHDYSDEVFIARSGKVIHWYTYRQWARFTSTMRNSLIHEHHNKIDDPILIGTSECKKCKKIFHPPMF